MEQKQLGSLIQSSLQTNKKAKQVNTPSFSIVGHLLRWEDTIIQIDNISMISIASFQQAPFPRWSIVLILVGLLLIRYSIFVALLCLAGGGLLIWFWNIDVQKTQNYKYLNIQLNSGRVFSLLFESDMFLKQVLDVFANIFEDDNLAGKNIYIDIKNCRIDDHSNVNIDASHNTLTSDSRIIDQINFNKSSFSK